jgi:hypothetical protein
MPKQSLIILTLLLFVILPSTTNAKDFYFNPPDGYKRKKIRPNDVYEICFDYIKHSSVSYTFKSTLPLNFNIHYHIKEFAVYPVLSDGVKQTSGIYKTPFTYEFCFMWQNNHSSPVHMIHKINLIQGSR